MPDRTWWGNSAALVAGAASLASNFAGMASSLVLIETQADGAVRVVTLNRPEKRNALNAEMLTEIQALFTAEPSADERVSFLQVDTGTERFADRSNDRDPFVSRRLSSEERLDLGQHLRVQCVAFFGPIEGDDTNRSIRLGFDQDQ